jgi:hypothetical protein
LWIVKENMLKNLLKEADELTAIFTASGKTAKSSGNPKSKIRNPKLKQ